MMWDAVGRREPMEEREGHTRGCIFLSLDHPRVGRSARRERIFKERGEKRGERGEQKPEGYFLSFRCRAKERRGDLGGERRGKRGK